MSSSRELLELRRKQHERRLDHCWVGLNHALELGLDSRVAAVCMHLGEGALEVEQGDGLTDVRGELEVGDRWKRGGGEPGESLLVRGEVGVRDEHRGRLRGIHRQLAE